MRALSVLLLAVVFVYSTAAASDSAADNKADGSNGSVLAADVQVGDPVLDVEWIEEQNGKYIPLDAVFKDETGESLTLGEFIDRPTLILPIYFYCPSSCSLNLVHLATAVKKSRLVPGRDFKIVAFSFNEEEGVDNARVAKRNYLRLLPEDFPAEDWKFLTGDEKNIKAVTEAIGYRFKPLEDGTFIHPSAMVAVSEKGMIIKYIYGSFIPGDVDMAISEASTGTPAKSVRRFLNYCFNYSTEKSDSFFNTVKFSVIGGFLGLGVLFFFIVRRKKRSSK